MNEISRIVVYGAGGHGKVVADVGLAMGFGLAGFLDDGAQPGTPIMVAPQGSPFVVLGDGTWLEAEHQPPVGVALGIGSNQTRRRIVERFSKGSFQAISLIHPSAVISPFARIGSGTVVMALAAINPGAAVGDGAIINTGAVVEHDVVIGDFAHVSPNATMAGAASLGQCSHLGTGATILPGIAVGNYCVVGAGAVVTRNVPDGTVVAGVPARFLRENR